MGAGKSISHQQQDPAWPGLAHLRHILRTLVLLGWTRNIIQVGTKSLWKMGKKPKQKCLS